MARHLITASAQMGPIAKSETRQDTVARLLEMMREAHSRGAKLVVFTEMALTTFFPRWMIDDEAELDSYYETAMPSAATQPLFDEAARLEGRCCRTLAVEDSHRESMRLDGPHEQTDTRPLPHDKLV